MRRIDAWITSKGSDAQCVLPMIFIRPGEDIFDGVLERLGDDIRRLTKNMIDPVVTVREWPFDYTKEEFLKGLLIEERDTDAL